MLYKETLLSEIRKLNDSSYEEFVEFPQSCSIACERWSESIFLFSKDILPASSTATVAKQTMKNSLQAICGSSNLIQSVTIFENSVIAYATQLALGMSSSNFTGIIPSSPLNLISIFQASMQGGTSLEFAIKLSNRLDEWFKTGLAVHNESGVTINWN